jgi:D-tyrosyl-tRNA(Tyr) deacylase
MRAVVQRVKHASVRVGEQVAARINAGLLVYLGVAKGDTVEVAAALAGKVAGLRIFNDELGRMNLSLSQTCGEVLVVSEFTLYGDCRKGRRPNYMMAASLDAARQLYVAFIQALQALGLRVATGEFQAMMEVEAANDGPVTLLLDSDRQF